MGCLVKAVWSGNWTDTQWLKQNIVTRIPRHSVWFRHIKLVERSYNGGYPDAIIFKYGCTCMMTTKVEKQIVRRKSAAARREQLIAAGNVIDSA
jgi:hypothetical protein